jgi:hypothetical protein
MENFFNWISKPMDSEDVEIWFNMNNMIPEKGELFFDFCVSLFTLMKETYLGDESLNYELLYLKKIRKNTLNGVGIKQSKILKKKTLGLILKGTILNTLIVSLWRFIIRKRITTLETLLILS